MPDKQWLRVGPVPRQWMEDHADDDDVGIIMVDTAYMREKYGTSQLPLFTDKITSQPAMEEALVFLNHQDEGDVGPRPCIGTVIGWDWSDAHGMVWVYRMNALGRAYFYDRAGHNLPDPYSMGNLSDHTSLGASIEFGDTTEVVRSQGYDIDPTTRVVHCPAISLLEGTQLPFRAGTFALCNNREKPLFEIMQDPSAAMNQSQQAGFDAGLQNEAAQRGGRPGFVPQQQQQQQQQYQQGHGGVEVTQQEVQQYNANLPSESEQRSQFESAIQGGETFEDQLAALTDDQLQDLMDQRAAQRSGGLPMASAFSQQEQRRNQVAGMARNHGLVIDPNDSISGKVLDMFTDPKQKFNTLMSGLTRFKAAAVEQHLEAERLRSQADAQKAIATAEQAAALATQRAELLEGFMHGKIKPMMAVQPQQPQPQQPPHQQAVPPTTIATHPDQMQTQQYQQQPVQQQYQQQPVQQQQQQQQRQRQPVQQQQQPVRQQFSTGYAANARARVQGAAPVRTGRRPGVGQGQQQQRLHTVPKRTPRVVGRQRVRDMLSGRGSSSKYAILDE